MKKLILTSILITLFISGTQLAIADIEGHKHGPHKNSHEKLGHHKHNIHRHSEPDEMHKHSSSEVAGMFLTHEMIDGYKVTFHAMSARKKMDHGKSHNFMVKVERDDKPIDVVAVNSKVKHPNGQTESEMMMKMGDWYMAGYDLGHPGQHQLMVLFKTNDGEKHFGGVFFPHTEIENSSQNENQEADHEQHH